MPEEVVGTVTHYFGKINVAGLTLTGGIKVGDTLHFKGHTTDFTQVVDSMQVQNADVQEGKAGDEVGLKVQDRVRVGDHVLLVTP
jgi:selenocysteine-specific translation elongation factor